MREAGVLADDGRLATDLAATLEPRFQDALNHPTRREILRVLQASRAPRGIEQIHRALPPLTRRELAYHVQVLRDSDCIAIEESWPPSAGSERLFRAEIGASSQALLVLRATENSDREFRRRGRHGRPRRFLTMLRIPHPDRSIGISLCGERSGRETGPKH
jgi:DNA-binding transcriptional ArsR family regulator